jgi:hypothetical protein
MNTHPSTANNERRESMGKSEKPAQRRLNQFESTLAEVSKEPDKEVEKVQSTRSRKQKKVLRWSEKDPLSLQAKQNNIDIERILDCLQPEIIPRPGFADRVMERIKRRMGERPAG